MVPKNCSPKQGITSETERLIPNSQMKSKYVSIRDISSMRFLSRSNHNKNVSLIDYCS